MIGQEYLSDEVQGHVTDDPARSLLRLQAASGAELTAVGCIGLTRGMLPRRARHSLFIFLKCKHFEGESMEMASESKTMFGDV